MKTPIKLGGSPPLESTIHRKSAEATNGTHLRHKSRPQPAMSEVHEPNLVSMLMNAPHLTAHAGTNHAHTLIEKARTFAQEEPTKALAAGLAAGILMNLLPSRLFSTAAKIAAPLVRPALLTLGVMKVVELCCREEPAAKSVE